MNHLNEMLIGYLKQLQITGILQKLGFPKPEPCLLELPFGVVVHFIGFNASGASSSIM